MKKVLSGAMVLLSVVVALLAGLVVVSGGFASADYKEALWDLQQIPDEEYHQWHKDHKQSTKKWADYRKARDQKLAEKRTWGSEQLFEHSPKSTQIVVGELKSSPTPTLMGNTAYDLTVVTGMKDLVQVAQADNLNKGDRVVVYQNEQGRYYALPFSEVVAKN